MMLKPKGWLARLCLLALLASPGFGGLHAQSTVTPEDEYKKLIRVNEDVQPLGEHPFGENISLYDGSLSFQQTDVSASGNGPLLQFSRKFQIEGYSARLERAEYAFGDWSIELPHLETFTGSGYTYTSSGWRTVSGWQVSVAPGVDPNARCSHFTQPPTISEHTGDPALVPWEPDSWWKGYHLVMPGQGGEDMLANLDPASEGTYPVVTKSHWRFSCLATTQNGQPGEGFLAQAPDGTKYWFNQLVYRYAPTMLRPLYSDFAGVNSSRGSFMESLFAAPADPVADLLGLLTGSSVAHAAPSTNRLSRKTALMLVTRIEDRFGNTLIFSYDASGNLTGIAANDGRALAVQYVSGTPLHSGLPIHICVFKRKNTGAICPTNLLMPLKRDWAISSA
jgi:YD repeat-containing protein